MSDPDAKNANIIFKEKKKSMTAMEDCVLTNPYRDAVNGNCMMCTAAFELRRRGYDVKANRPDNDVGGFPANKFLDWFPDAKIEPFWPKGVFDIISNNYAMNSIGGNRQLAKKVLSSLVSQGEGARGNLMAAFTPSSGHSMAYEIKNGKVKLYDSQIGIERDAEKVLRHCFAADVIRLDNAMFIPEKIKEAVS